MMNKAYIVAFAALMVSGCGFEIVDTGHRGVQTRFGEVVSETALPEGFYTYNPLTSDIVEIDTRVKKFEGNTSAYTQDVQQVEIVYTINFHPKRDAVVKLYEEVGLDWAETLLPQLIEGNTKNVIGNYKAVALIENRLKATQDIETLIRQAALERDIVVTEVELPNFEFTTEFEHAVERKVTAIQRAQEAENNTKRISEEAKQRVIAAEAEAKSMQIRAEALTQNKNLVEYEAVQKWNGVLPQQILGGAVPFIDVGKASNR